MDIGSSTGGFTDCCLQNGAKKAVCIDVGTDVMHPILRHDTRVELYENTNIKDVHSNLFKQIELIFLPFFRRKVGPKNFKSRMTLI